MPRLPRACLHTTFLGSPTNARLLTPARGMGGVVLGIVVMWATSSTVASQPSESTHSCVPVSCGARRLSCMRAALVAFSDSTRGLTFRYHVLTAAAAGLDGFVVNVNPRSDLQVEVQPWQEGVCLPTALTCSPIPAWLWPADRVSVSRCG